MNSVEKVIIIGGGPAGLAAALYTARANLGPLVIAGSPPGGQLTLTSHVENYPGFESILGSDLILKMRKHAEKFGARVIDENIINVDFSTKPFKIYLQEQQKNLITASAVIISTGAKALWLGLESEQRLRGKGVSACAICDGFFFRNKVVAVVGGGDTAIEEALVLTNFAQKVYLIHRRDSFRASKIMQERVLQHPKIEIIWNTEVVEVLGKEKVEGIRLKTDSILKLDGLFVAIGHKPDTDLFKDKIELDKKGYIITSVRKAIDIASLLHGSTLPVNRQVAVKTMKPRQTWLAQFANFDFSYQYMTTVPGVFAAGDCVDYKYRQAATAVGMGVAAALEAEDWLGK